MRSRSKAVEEQVVMRNDLRGRQNRSIAREMRVGYQRHIVAKRNGAAASRIDTVFGHATHNDEMSNFGTLLRP